ncbi:MAG: DNA polymerase III subunit delta [Cytophagia bacterium]|nr:MAG: DNA polymerase III subunit delta [Runella sp.]TAG22192.1 MAG: DNA polymerase III subunit delta [Cytophagales bacterium]TAG41281.1 MAG: DNA polymerase III subunit delta [Cytophagia bacterium]TAG52861.1 MAG: DNA polymerase III subunit delta [Runella slithyformis]TAG82963.1 MAG: DNA polymerase III subunit delta [Cytophagales bacterium]
MTATPEQALKEIRQKKIQPLYFIHGDEPFYIEQLADALEKAVVPESEKSFNQFVVFGKDLEVGAVVNYARRFPFMAERQLVLVKEAQQVAGIDNKDKNALLEQYALNPLPSTVLAICFQGNFDARKSLPKSFEKNGVLVQSKKMYDNKLPDWVAEYIRSRGAKVSPKAIQMLVEYIGNDLKRIASEVDKMLFNLTVAEEISAAVVEKYVGISKEYNVFELQKALTQRDVLKANRIANYLAANPKENPLPQVLIILYNFFSKLLIVHSSRDKSEAGVAAALGINAFFAKDYLLAARNYNLWHTVQIISALRQADNASKGIETGAANSDAILKELVFKILH